MVEGEGDSVCSGCENGGGGGGIQQGGETSSFLG